MKIHQTTWLLKFCDHVNYSNGSVIWGFHNFEPQTSFKFGPKQLHDFVVFLFHDFGTII